MKLHHAVAAALAATAAAQTCPTDNTLKQDCYPYATSNATVCAAHGCCWQPTDVPNTPWCFHTTRPTPSAAQCSAVTTASRLDCFPEPFSNQGACNARGCCWDMDAYEAAQAKAEGGEALQGTPWCFFPLVQNGYVASAPVNTAPNGGAFTSSLSLPSSYSGGPFGNDISPLQLSVSYDSASRLHFKVFDSAVQRWEPPVPLNNQLPSGPVAPADTDFAVSLTQAPFRLAVTRRSTGQVMFDTGNVGTQTSNGLIFSDQYLELTTALPAGSGSGASAPHIYGLAEHVVSFQLQSNGTAGQTYTLFAKDQGTPVHNPLGATNLYASQPFYMVHDPSTGDAFGVLLFNSNAMDVVLQQNPNQLTYRVVGGVFDFYIFSGPSPQDVIRQYQELVGFPRMPPRWALGFHLCRWGYNSLAQTQNITHMMLAEDMPQESQWNDIDYMDKYLDFTTDPVAYPSGPMAAWIRTLQSQYGMKYVQIFDPGISNQQAPGAYPAYDQGVANKVFINDTHGNILVGKVWPGFTAFPDWTAPNVASWWTNQIAAYHTTIPFDGMWIDMNEASNFCVGECDAEADVPLKTLEALKAGELEYDPAEHKGRSLMSADTRAKIAAKRAARRAAARAAAGPSPSPSPAELAAPAIPPPVGAAADKGAFPGDPQYPPYLPGRVGGEFILEDKTLAMTGRNYAGLQYNLHNLFGWGEALHTAAALEKVRGKRSMVISRSTFPTSGALGGGHWLGDNEATWADLYYSIPGILTFNMLGIPLVGSDTCGFGGPATTPELCSRWMALSAWTAGFYRNHNTINKQEQAPAVFPDPYRSYMRDFLNQRLTMLPYWYTLFAEAHANGTAVTRALLLEFPTDAVVPPIDTQVMLGSAFLVSPVLTQGATSVRAYFPAGVGAWYDWASGSSAGFTAGTWQTLPAPLSTIPVHMRSGHVVATQTPNMTTTFTVQNEMQLHVALDPLTGTAAGSLYLDDGDSIGTYEAGAYTQVEWGVVAKPDGSAGTLTATPVVAGYTPPAGNVVASLRIMGVSRWSASSTVTVNGAPAASVSYDAANKVLNVGLGVPVAAAMTLAWSF